MKVWIIEWLEDGLDTVQVFSSKEKAWSYICNYFDRIGNINDEGFHEIFKSYNECCQENKDYFMNEYIAVVEKTIDSEEW